MAGFSYDSRRKLTETWLKEMTDKGKQLSKGGKSCFLSFSVHTAAMELTRLCATR
ncbi:MAG: hypothetical protein K2H91_01720 [Lachnospiraceae bacterium]|nr:hypothetical protein [Lachnospiraceae bacterium]